MDPLIVSGGANGSDYAWTKAAVKHEFRCEIMSFHYHRMYHVAGARRKILNYAKFWYCESRVKCVARRLGRLAYPYKETYHLLCRNIVIGTESDMLLATTNADLSHKHGKNVGIPGGTAWPCQTFAGQHSDEPKMRMAVYSEKDGMWYQCCGGNDWQFSWMPIGKDLKPWLKQNLDESVKTIGLVGMRTIQKKTERVIAATVKKLREVCTV